MSNEHLHLYNENEIYEKIKLLAKYYAPQWNANENDVLTTLMRLFAKMTAENYSLYPQIIERLHLLYANFYGLEKKPAVPAMGYVTVKTTGKMVLLKKGTRLGSDNDSDFETLSDLCAVSANIKQFFYTYDNYIGASNFSEKQATFFDFEGENLQEQSIYFSADDLLYSDSCNSEISNNCCSVLLFDTGSPDQRGVFPRIKTSGIEWSYLTAGGEKKIHNFEQEDNKFTLHIPEAIELTTVGAVTGRWLKASFNDDNMLGHISPETFMLTASKNELSPHSLYLNEIMLAKENFLPFGEKPNEYDCFYICSNECFSKKNSIITITLDYDYQDIENPIYKDLEIKWKTVIPASQFEPKPPLIKLIESAAWEYWNGYGWRRIFEDDSHTDAFSKIENNQLKVTFPCPDDASETFVGAEAGLFVRCRIAKITAGYADNMIYRLPLIRKVNMEYSYKGNFRRADRIFLQRNLTLSEINPSGIYIKKEEQPQHSYTYLCFDEALPIGYVSAYFKISVPNCNSEPMFWECYTVKNGKRCWRDIVVGNMIDGFTESGIVSFGINDEMRQATLFGKSGYWLRACIKGKAKPFYCDAIYINTVPVIQSERRAPMFFSISPYSSQMNYQLADGQIYNVEVSELVGENWEIVDKSNYHVDNEKGIVSLNKIRQNIVDSDEPMLRIDYSVTAGSEGNLAPGKLNRFLDPIPFIDKVENPESTFGGMDIESFEQCLARGSSNIYSLGRCISENDYEIAARNSDSSIVKVKCYSNTDNNGKILLVVLTKEDNVVAFKLTRKAIIDSIHKIMPFYLKSKLEVIQTEYIAMKVVTHLTVSKSAYPQMIHQEIENRLCKFLNPIHGNSTGKGFDIGEFPNEQELRHQIANIAGVRTIESLQILCKLNGEDFDVEKLNELRNGVPIYAKPEIFIKIATDDPS